MPPLIVDLSQDSDDGEFYVAQQFLPNKRSPPTLSASKLPPLKKQARTPRRTSSSSSSSLSLMSPSRKPQQPITSFFSSPNIKREVVQKPITSFFPFPPREIHSIYSNPRPPLVIFTNEELDVDNNEAPLPKSFEAPNILTLGHSAGSPAEITSSPPASPEVIAIPYTPPSRANTTPADTPYIDASFPEVFFPALTTPHDSTAISLGEAGKPTKRGSITAAETATKSLVEHIPPSKIGQRSIKPLPKRKILASPLNTPLKNSSDENRERKIDIASRSTIPISNSSSSGGVVAKYPAIASGSGSGPGISTGPDFPFPSLPPKDDGGRPRENCNRISSRFRVVSNSKKGNTSDSGDKEQNESGFEMEVQDYVKPNSSYPTRFHNSTSVPTPSRYTLPQPQAGFDPMAVLKAQDLSRKTHPVRTISTPVQPTSSPPHPLEAEYDPHPTRPTPIPQSAQPSTRPLSQLLSIAPQAPVATSCSPTPLSPHSHTPAPLPLPRQEAFLPRSTDDNYNDDDFPDDDDFPANLAPLKRNESGEVICNLHGDPQCAEPECVHVFFEKYCPFRDTVPDENTRLYTEYVPRHRMPAQPAEVVENVVEPAKIKRELIAVMIASGELGRKRRLPYMSFAMKDYVRNSAGAMSELMKNCDGEILHVQFTAKEVLHLGNAVLNYIETNGLYIDYPPQSDDLYKDIHYLLAAAFAGYENLSSEFELFLTTVEFSLPGRYPEDVQNFMMDAFTSIPDPHDPFIFVELHKKQVFRSAITRRVKTELGWGGTGQTLGVKREFNDVFGMFEPVWKFEEGSSDVHDIVWAQDGTRFSMATTCFNDGYNRPGNLMLGTVDPWKVKMLYRHAFRVRAQSSGNLERYSYATVSSVRFSNDSSLLFSSSYDGFVKVWSTKDSSWISDVHLGDQIMLMESSRMISNLLAVGCFKGSVNILNIDDSGSLTNSAILHISKAEELRKGLYPSCFAWGNKDFPNLLISGYDNSAEDQKHGGLAIWDVEYSRNLFKGSTKGFGNPQRHFDVSMHETGGKFVTASLKPGRYTKGSVVRLYDLADTKCAVEFDSTQADINKVTISPCQRYITSSGTNGSTMVWDTRYPADVLIELEHDASVLPTTETTNVEAEDTGVTFAQWGRYSDSFFTGSSDGKIKQWDITTGNPFIRDIAQVDTQIMGASFSPSWDELIVGECSGTATLFSTRGDKGVPPSKVVVDWTEKEGKISPDGENMPFTDWDGRREREVQEEVQEEDSGVQMARELVDEGLMWVDDKGMAWATDKYEKMMKDRKKGKKKA